MAERLRCRPGRTPQGFPVAGRPRVDGMLEPAEPGIFELACTSGALGKCVRFGYRPWAFAQGLELRELYNACIRMVRADYCGNGTATTKDGQAIDMYDDLGIQKPENDPAMEFEAGWTEEGAACVRHTRVKENATLETLVAACPRLKDRVGPPAPKRRRASSARGCSIVRSPEDARQADRIRQRCRVPTLCCSRDRVSHVWSVSRQ